MSINYITGDVTKPCGNGIKIIVHVVNNIGKWGRGFVLSLSKRWKEPEIQYRQWFNNKKSVDFLLGSIQLVQVEPDIFVANMIAQYDIYHINDIPPIRYSAIRSCLEKVREFAQQQAASIHAPRFGAGLAGGDWHTIELIINEELIQHGISVTVYDL